MLFMVSCKIFNCNGSKLSEITKKDKEISKNLNYDGINFPAS